MGILLHSAFFLAHTGLWTISSEGGWSLLCVMRLTPLRDVSAGREEPFPVNYTFLEALPLPPEGTHKGGSDAFFYHTSTHPSPV